MTSFNHRITRGDTKRFNLKLTRKDANGVAQPENLTGTVLWFTAKERVSDTYANALIRKSNASLGGIVVTDAAQGLATLTISPADTSGFTQSKILRADIQLQTAGGDVETVAEGTLEIELDVTDTTTP